MHDSGRISAALKRGGFSLHFFVHRWLKIGFLGQCWLTTGVAIAIIVIASFFDKSWILPGRNVGLLEHPGIWAFFCIQIAIPLSLRNSIKTLLKARSALRLVGALDKKSSTELLNRLLCYLNLKTSGSKFTATALYSAGLIAFVWNTYQNQFPGKVVPFDFWDSKNYAFGFWTTRVYKFYLFVWLLPFAAFLHVGILTIGLRIIRKARNVGTLKLLPFHPDGVGGLGFVAELVTRPLLVAAALSALPTAAAFYVHREADVTPLMGLAVSVLGVTVAYLVPILMLRSDIVATKSAMLEKLRWMQQSKFAQIFESQKLDSKIVQTENANIEGIEKLCLAIKGVSNYPHLKRLFAIITLAMTPMISSLLGKIYEGCQPFIHHLITSP